MKPPWHFEVSHDRDRTAFHVNGECILEVNNRLLNVPFRWWKPSTWKYRWRGMRLEFWMQPEPEAMFNLKVDTIEPGAES